MRQICKNVSPRPTGLFCRFFWKDTECLPASRTQAPFHLLLSSPIAPFLLPLPNCFIRVCLPTLFAAVLKFFLPLTTSAISGTANSNKSAPTRFAAGALYLTKNGIAVLPITCASVSNPRPRRPIPL